MRLMVTEGASVEEASMALTWRRIAQMKDAHRQKAMASMTKTQATKLQRVYAKLTKTAAQMTELYGAEDLS
jgi:predicted transglutaminase-like cysteine proteinase